MTHQAMSYETLIRQRGFRVTPQRQMILDTICDSGGHITPEQIYEHVHRKAPAVNLATIYRTVDFLRDLRLVTQTYVDGKIYYEIAGELPHHHLRCRVCGHMEQIDHTTVAALFATIEQEQGFTVEADHLMLAGVCKSCHPHESSINIQETLQ